MEASKSKVNEEKFRVKSPAMEPLSREREVIYVSGATLTSA